MDETLVEIGECPTHGYLYGDQIDFDFPTPSRCAECGAVLTDVQFVDERVLQEALA